MFLATCATAAARQQRQLLGLRCFASSAGLFGIEQLRQPEDFRKLVETTKTRCSALVEEAVSAPSGIEAIRKTDELSDTICKTSDAAELCRNVHTSSQWRAEAQNACISLGGFLAQLNVHQGLYDAVASAVGASRNDAAAQQLPGQAHSDGGMSAEGGAAGSHSGGGNGPVAGAGQALPAAALRVGQLLLQDFEAHGVHLQGDAQRRFLDASAREQLLCMQFGQNLGNASKYGWFNMSTKAADLLAPLSPNARVQVQRNGRTLRVPTHEGMLQEVLTRVPESHIRRQAYQVGYTSPRANLAVVQRLLDTRQEVAELLGAPSYAHYQAGRDTLARHPAAVTAFLEGLGEAVRGKAQEEVRLLQRHSGGTAVPEVWDEQFLRTKAQAAEGLTGTPALCTLPECLARLDYLCRRLLDVRLASVPLAAGEAWAPDLQKLALVDGSSKEEIGHLYLDLYARSGKVQGPGVQFTLVNGRQLPDGSYQRPCVALVCNFPPAAAAPLSVIAVQTLFHEFGHVLNALLNATEFQHVAGTRGTADTVELASQLFEYFVEDPRVFGGDAAPAAALKQHAAQQRMFAALEVQRQVLYARLDQELHLNGGAPPQTDLVEHLMAATLSFPPMRGLKPQARFAHLATAGGHGSKYYSYLYSKALAAAVWETHLAGDPFHAAAGQHLREKLLSVGLSVSPRQLATDLLGDPAVVPCAEAGFHPDSRHLLAEIGA